MVVKMKNKYIMFFIILFTVVITSCDSGPKNNDPKTTTPNTNTTITGISAQGKIYFETNCTGCHAAGTDDTTTAFGATDLKLTKDIKTDMSVYGDQSNLNLMARFSNVSAQRVADLKAYMASLNTP